MIRRLTATCVARPVGSLSHRQRPTVVDTVYELKAVRRTAVDCERQTTDEVVQGAWRNALPLTSAPNEYQVHGEFKMAAEDRAFPDTCIFTLAQLHAAGCRLEQALDPGEAAGA